jgi:hypothetical protein
LSSPTIVFRLQALARAPSTPDAEILDTTKKVIDLILDLKLTDKNLNTES